MHDQSRGYEKPLGLSPDQHADVVALCSLENDERTADEQTDRSAALQGDE
ncbi:hypothetical protein ABZY19_39005 [Streptomyces sp. NPDC006475]